MPDFVDRVLVDAVFSADFRDIFAAQDGEGDFKSFLVVESRHG